MIDDTINETHEPSLVSWVESANAPSADFPIQNLPLGVFSRRRDPQSRRIGVAIGDQILDLRKCHEKGVLAGLSHPLQLACCRPTLNALMALGPEAASALRACVSATVRAGAPVQADLLVPMAHVDLNVPAEIGDYTDFYASIFHATRVGALFRPTNPLSPNYKHQPIGYHGRSSSIVVSGTSFNRPWGQFKRSERDLPVFRPTERLDYEMEIAAVVGRGTDPGQRIALEDAEQHVFGLCLLNDWSARDIQAWESQPLGPFLAKNFATSISPWVVTIEALAPFRSGSFARASEDPPLLPHLRADNNETAGGFDITVDAFLQSSEMRARNLEPFRLGRARFRDMYWTMAQLIAHHASGGCNLRVGDVIASGTVSGDTDGSSGCLLEITRASQPVELPSGETRLFLADGDTVVLRAFCERAGRVRIGFGDCAGTVLPATDHATDGD